MFASASSAALVAGLLALASKVAAHAEIITVYGANGRQGMGYGVNRYGKFPRKMGRPGDAGGDVAVFRDGKFPKPACGSTGELGEIDTVAWLSQAEGFGIPSAHPNASVVFKVFQVNRDGGGPMKCEYSSDASLSDSSWTPMTMTLNMAGKGGFRPVQRVNETVVATFPQHARCTGGIAGNTCVVRCRTGINARTKVQGRFGGCFAVRLNGTEGAVESSSSTSPHTPNPPHSHRHGHSHSHGHSHGHSHHSHHSHKTSKPKSRAVSLSDRSSSSS